MRSTNLLTYLLTKYLCEKKHVGSIELYETKTRYIEIIKIAETSITTKLQMHFMVLIPGDLKPVSSKK